MLPQVSTFSEARRLPLEPCLPIGRPEFNLIAYLQRGLPARLRLNSEIHEPHSQYPCPSSGRTLPRDMRYTKTK